MLDPLSNPSQSKERREAYKAKTSAVPANASPATPSVAAAVSSPKPKDAPKGPPRSQRENPESRCRLRKTQRLHAYPIECPIVVFMEVNANVVM